MVAKGVPRLPRLRFPPWTPPSEAPPPEKESPGGETHPPTRFISGALRAPSAWGPWGRIARTTGPGASSRAQVGRRTRGSRPLHSRLLAVVPSAPLKGGSLNGQEVRHGDGATNAEAVIRLSRSLRRARAAPSTMARQRGRHVSRSRSARGRPWRAHGLGARPAVRLAPGPGPTARAWVLASTPDRGASLVVRARGPTWWWILLLQYTCVRPRNTRAPSWSERRPVS